MVYSRTHLSCDEKDCKILSSYVRDDKKWIKVGYFTTGCKKFVLCDTEEEIGLQQAVRAMRHSRNRPKKSQFVIYLQDLMS